MSTSDESKMHSEQQSEQQKASVEPTEGVSHEPPRAYPYPHATDHAPVAPVPDDLEHEVKSYGGAPEGGT